MAANYNDLEQFFLEFDQLLKNIETTSDNMALEYMERKLENFVGVLVGIMYQLESHSRRDNEIIGLLRELLQHSFEQAENIRKKLCQGHNEIGCCLNFTITTSRTGGHPQFLLTKDQLQNLRETGMSWKAIALCLNISESTLYRRVAKFDLNQRFTAIPDQDLDQLLRSIIGLNPRAGEKYIRGSLRSRGINVERRRVRERLHKIDPIGRAERRSLAIQRRVYNVPAPNCLWHIDTNHKLIAWRFVFHGCIDGYSRMIIYVKCTDNNLASTAAKYFIDGVSEYGFPSTVRGDCGVENYDIARFMISGRGTGRGSFITGRSVHNTRIERLWREVNRIVGHIYSEIFKHMESIGILDSTNEMHLYALHFVFMPRIVRSLEEFHSQWNFRGIRTACSSSPLALWHSGYNDALNQSNDDDTEGAIVVPDNVFVLSREQQHSNCSVICIAPHKKRKAISTQYYLHGHLLDVVDASKYLGVTITNKLSWDTQVSNTAGKASRTISFLRRNLRECTSQVKDASYKAMARPILEYALTVWDPCSKANIQTLEQVQRRAARYVFNDYSTKTPGCVTKMLSDLAWKSL
eukprot:gene16370-18012_t